MSMTLAEYESEAKQDRSEWLGELFVFSVPDVKVHHDSLAARLTAKGLDAYIPRAPRDEDIFRRIWTNGQRQSIKTADPEVIENILVRQVARENGKILKRIVIERVNAAGKKLGYTEAMDVEFDASAPHRLVFTDLGLFHTETTSMVAKLRDEYLAERGHVNGQAVREIVRRVLESCWATSLRPGGGVYFVKPDYADKVQALEDVSDLIDGAYIHTLPIVDTAKQREKVQRAYEMEARKELDRIIVEMSELVRSGEEITPERAAAFAREVRHSKQKLSEYQGFLNEHMDTVESKLQVSDAVLAQVLMQVKSD